MLMEMRGNAARAFVGSRGGLCGIAVIGFLGLSVNQAVLAQTPADAAESDAAESASEVRGNLLAAQAELAQNLVRLNAIIAYQEGLLAGIQSDGALLGARPDPGAVCGEGSAGICAYFPVTFANKDP